MTSITPLEIVILLSVAGVLISITAFILVQASKMDSKIGRVYARFDENKDKVETSFVRTEVCDVKYDHIVRDLTELKGGQVRQEQKMDKLLKKNGVT